VWPKSVWYVAPVMYGGATLVGSSRMYHNNHWASDVALGAAIGTFSGLKVVRYSHAHPDNKLDHFILGASIFPSPGGERCRSPFRRRRRSADRTRRPVVYMIQVARGCNPPPDSPYGAYVARTCLRHRRSRGFPSRQPLPVVTIVTPGTFTRQDLAALKARGLRAISPDQFGRRIVADRRVMS
jgi:hypothetical protein